MYIYRERHMHLSSFHKLFSLCDLYIYIYIYTHEHTEPSGLRPPCLFQVAYCLLCANLHMAAHFVTAHRRNVLLKLAFRTSALKHLENNLIKPAHTDL